MENPGVRDPMEHTSCLLAGEEGVLGIRVQRVGVMTASKKKTQEMRLGSLVVWTEKNASEFDLRSVCLSDIGVVVYADEYNVSVFWADEVFVPYYTHDAETHIHMLVT